MAIKLSFPQHSVPNEGKNTILHHNFPAQFRFLALDAKAGHELFLSERNSTGTLSKDTTYPSSWDHA